MPLKKARRTMDVSTGHTVAVTLPSLVNFQCLLCSDACHVRVRQCLCGCAVPLAIEVLALVARCHYPRWRFDRVFYPPVRSKFSIAGTKTAELCSAWTGGGPSLHEHAARFAQNVRDG